jgi:Glycosyl-4,4'-diaponeurosporenoate acyltransferase
MPSGQHPWQSRSFAPRHKSAKSFSSEAVHWLTFAVTVMLAILYLRDDHAVYGYVMLLVRIPFDLYPIMLQRWNRGRVWRVLERPSHTI